MDDCQITGAASSYARKYALNGLFLLDDTKDADSEEYRNETAARAKGQAQSQPRTQQKSQQQKQQSPAQAKNYEGPKVTPEHLADIKNAMMAAGIPEATICKAYKVGTMESLPDVMYEAIMGRIKATVQQKAKQQPANGGWTGGGAA